MLKLIRSIVAQRIAAGFILGAAAMLVIQPVEKPVEYTPGPVPTLAPLA